MPIPEETIMPAASVAGAAAGALGNRSGDTFGRRLADLLIGAFAGVALGPAIADAASAQGEHLRTAIAFLVGLCGIVICTAVLDAMKGFKVADWVARFVTPKVPPP